MKMMKSIKYIFGAIVAVAMAACSADDMPMPVPDGDNGGAVVVGDSIRVNVSLQVPEMPEESTRAMGPNVDYNNMHLYLLEFADNGNPQRNTLTAVYEAQNEQPLSDHVQYQVTLKATTEPRILHLVAVPKNYTLSVPYGIESTVMSDLTVANGTEAYWNRLTFPQGYAGKGEGDTAVALPELNTKLQHVPLIRNFSEVTMTSNADNFKLLGFAIVNNPDRGTVAPYDAANASFPSFIDANANPLPYQTISSSYSGILPYGTEFNNQEAGPSVSNDLNAKYIYERPFNSLSHTFIIIKGQVLKTNAAVKAGTYYYKLDLGKNDSQGVFNYYNLLRNFSYNINIKNVGAAGYATALEAAQGVVYNNFSFDINIGHLLNISDGNEVVFVNFTTAVMTEPKTQTVAFKYRYRNLNASGTSYNNNGVNFINLESGDVIQSVNMGTNDDKDGWRTVTINCKPATPETKVQSFIMVKPSGLGRTINLVLHEKWDYKNAVEYKGSLQNWGEEANKGVADATAKAPLTVFFDIPDNLPEAMFPMEFIMEADRQNIENNPIGTLVVTSGPSRFPSANGQTRIKYIKTVTWDMYNAPLDPNNTGSNGTAITNADGSVTHRVRCRFRTTTNLSEVGVAVGNTVSTNILIRNDNFNDGIVTFTRTRIK